ncbi:MAG: hypothetical protein ABJN84_01610 [Flavobacteriaceae bacterium]
MTSKLKVLLVITIIGLAIGCKEKQDLKQPDVKAEVVEDINGVPLIWIGNRVEKAKERLNSSEAGKVIWNAMEAHGGLKKWFANGALSMRFNYQPLDGKTQRDSYQVVDSWGSRAVHHSTLDSTASYGWTGKTAWMKAKDSAFFKYDTKFWAMTPLYLMGFPFVLDGQGVNLELLPRSNYMGRPNDVVKITYDEGTGDAPDDYYILHFDAQTHLLLATRYIVSYPGYFKKGEHLPEKFMEIGPLVNIEGILLPSELKTHWTVDGLPGDYLTLIEISEMSFKKDLAEDYFDLPENAKEL